MLSKHMHKTVLRIVQQHYLYWNSGGKNESVDNIDGPLILHLAVTWVDSCSRVSLDYAPDGHHACTYSRFPYLYTRTGDVLRVYPFLKPVYSAKSLSHRDTSANIMPYPRPILKRFGASSDDSDSPNFHEGGLSRMSARTNKVHFPNHPDALTRMHLAHSPDDYDRSPIRIKPNACALPERGCPGRTYQQDEPQDNVDLAGNYNYTNPQASPVCLRRGDHRHPCAKVAGFLMDGNSNGERERHVSS